MDEGWAECPSACLACIRDSGSVPSTSLTHFGPLPQDGSARCYGAYRQLGTSLYTLGGTHWFSPARRAELALAWLPSVHVVFLPMQGRYAGHLHSAPVGLHLPQKLAVFTDLGISLPES